jgi:hypothetical protein
MSSDFSSQVFGSFEPNVGDSHEYLTIMFSPSSVPLRERWRNNRLSATFLADYFSTFFPGQNHIESLTDPRSDCMGSIVFIANELLENAMKFSDQASNAAVTLTLQLFPNKLVFLTKNQVNQTLSQRLKAFIHRVAAADPMQLYMAQIENTAETEESGLGLLTIMNDYAAQVGWKLEPGEQGTLVTTQVQLDI